MKEREKKFLSVWAWAGFVLITYGVILFSCGIFYIFYPPPPLPLIHMNPDLWWGLFMLVSGIILFLWGRK